jgi:hypothetical protein
MSNSEAKTEIIELLDQIPDQYFPTVLEYIKDLMLLREQDEEAIDHLSEIMEEDDNLLKRLAK